MLPCHALTGAHTILTCAECSPAGHDVLSMRELRAQRALVHRRGR